MAPAPGHCARPVAWRARPCLAPRAAAARPDGSRRSRCRSRGTSHAEQAQAVLQITLAARAELAGALLVGRWPGAGHARRAELAERQHRAVAKDLSVERGIESGRHLK